MRFAVSGAACAGRMGSGPYTKGGWKRDGREKDGAVRESPGRRRTWGEACYDGPSLGRNM